ncbi:RNA-binding protein Hfq [Alkalithermobacter thermoalcaliphilus JW-YL-7 = DSM 7308]|uniref:RNA-binding protein Hfq n=1 Tax=Alkalithermobacter thermoalcaliphilus JW-YL-7 = DSM 7308 TaxID=1121328 RepID=A0A150FQG4_CLOPD|nr:Protein hfq [[Clostridium] paradoxum JW-YL-7 = DSM 7308]SHK80548.1 RNA-binding protein Hfq [[Clostridium] paradoxum JW-YL-7 = DSM 7308]
MKNNSLNLQDLFLNQSRKEKISITIFLVNGVQLKGTVKGFDNYIILLENEGKQQMIYKHAISTIIPSRNISLTVNNSKN